MVLEVVVVRRKASFARFYEFLPCVKSSFASSCKYFAKYFQIKSVEMKEDRSHKKTDNDRIFETVRLIDPDAPSKMFVRRC